LNKAQRAQRVHEKVYTYHIGIIVVTGPCDLTKVSLIIAIEVQNTLYTIPTILDVSIISPDVAILGNQGIVGLQTKKIMNQGRNLPLSHWPIAHPEISRLN
jgi:hypothetical protein